MNIRLCEWQPEYVAGELQEDQRAEFELHMLTCDECRRNVQLDKEIDGLLLAAHQATDEGSKDSLVERADRRLGTEIVRSRVLATLWVLVPTILFMTILWRNAPAPDENAPRPAKKVAQKAPAPIRSKEKTVSQPLKHSTDTLPNVTSDTHLAVEIKTSDPEVKLLWFYPTETTHKEPKK